MKNTGNGLIEHEPEVKKSNSTAAPPSAVTSKDYESDLPIDRGYAWVIVFACLVCNIICLGLQRAYGILFVAFLHMYNLPVTVTALVLAIQAAFMSASGFVSQTVLLSLLSERQTIIIGGFIGGVGITISYFASTLFLLILTQSVLVGIANGMIMGPVMVIVGKYFNKRRSLAMAVATLGGNLGSMFMPLYTEALMDAYGVRGALLVLGATFLNVMVFAGLLRPLHSNPGRRRVKKSSPDVATTTEAENHLLNHHAEETSGGGKQSGADPQRWSLHEEDLHSSRHRLQKGSQLYVSAPELYFPANIPLRETDDDSVDDDSIDEKHRNHNNAGHELQPLNYDNNAKDQTRLQPDGKTAKSSSTSALKKRTRWARVAAMFDFSLFKKPAFLLVLMTSSLMFLPAALMGMYLPALAADKGVTGQSAALLLTIFGGCGIFSRLAFGYLADVNCIRRAYLMALLMTLSCTAALFTPLYDNYSLLVFFSLTYGMFGIVFFSLMPVVVVDLVGLQNMSKTLGFIQLFQGIILAVSHPIIGALRDKTGQYHGSYYFMASAGLVCSFMLLFTPLVTRSRRNQDIMLP